MLCFFLEKVFSILKTNLLDSKNNLQIFDEIIGYVNMHIEEDILTFDTEFI